MAVSKLWSINEGGLSRVLQYAANPKKTNRQYRPKQYNLPTYGDRILQRTNGIYRIYLYAAAQLL